MVSNHSREQNSLFWLDHFYPYSSFASASRPSCWLCEEEEDKEEEEEDQADEEDNEEEKLIIRKDDVMEERCIEYYSSSHKLLLVGEGDFSFSACLALAFGSATNMVATSLDSREDVIRKYKEAKSNLENLEKLGACVLHEIDATKVKLHTDLQMWKFDRIIFNFPHAGFKGKENYVRVIKLHKNLVHGFFGNARGMLSANGEVHVNHKTTVPFCCWNLEELASRNSLALIECVDFEIENYPGYNNKRGAGSRCDEPFPLGECSTFKFRFSPTARKMFRLKNHLGRLTCRPQQLEEITIPMQQPPTSLDFRYPQTNFIENMDDVLDDTFAIMVQNCIENMDDVPDHDTDAVVVQEEEFLKKWEHPKKAKSMLKKVTDDFFFFKRLIRPFTAKIDLFYD